MAIVAIITACSSGSRRFTIDARFLNMNQANFYVYSPDGIIDGIDTIAVQAGRFTYERDMLLDEGTIVIVFPNYATMPIFVSAGSSIDIEANAAHLRSMEVTGTDDNELYTEWRQQSEKMSPAELRKHAENFITDHPASSVSRWLVLQHFVLSPDPDYKKAKALLTAMLKATDNNIHVAMMLNNLKTFTTLHIGDPLPRFSAKDIDGNPVLNGKLQSGRAIICLWASWNYESLSMLRQLASHKRYASDSTRVDNIITISLDPDLRQCRKTLKECGAENLTTICDTMLWQSPLISTFGFTTVPDNIRLYNGKIRDKRVPLGELLKKQ